MRDIRPICTVRDDSALVDWGTQIGPICRVDKPMRGWTSSPGLPAAGRSSLGGPAGEGWAQALASGSGTAGMKADQRSARFRRCLRWLAVCRVRMSPGPFGGQAGELSCLR